MKYKLKNQRFGIEVTFIVIIRNRDQMELAAFFTPTTLYFIYDFHFNFPHPTDLWSIPFSLRKSHCFESIDTFVHENKTIQLKLQMDN